ncbi:MAG: galactosyldiacylglycerol synthase, partial [Candidatus Omnitrophota bacterium]
ITDFKLHLFWLSKYVDNYIVEADNTKQELVSRRIDENKIKVCGIPIDKKFSVEKDKEEIIRRLRVGKYNFIILVMGGGLGVGPIREIVIQLQHLEADCQILVVCGHNKTLFKKLSALKTKFIKPTFIYGFCNNMDEIMFLADIMVSKVGGMSSSESLASQLPIIAIAPIPGQEMRNAKFLLDNGVGFKIKKPKEVISVVSNLLSDESRFLKIKEKIAKLAKPKAAEDIARFALQQL